MSTLYRDYRPNNFSELLGQNHIKITLQNELAANNLGHAYLFCGPRAVGKTTTARILAKAANCLQRKEGEFEPCNECNNCLSIKQGNNLDVLEIDAASNTGIDNVRENIISFSRIAPSNGKFKIFIVDEVHMLSTQAFNALLKIMEEPPSYVIFILCTTEIQKVPGTIISRCERFDFKKLSLAETVEKLNSIVAQEKVSVDKDVLEAVARRSGGYMRDAESLLGQVLSIGGTRIRKEQAELILPPTNDREAMFLLEYLLKKDVIKALVLLNNLNTNGTNIKNFNNDLINITRRLLLDKVSPGLSDSLGLDLGEDLEKEIIKLNQISTAPELIAFLKKFMETSSAAANLNIPQLPLEIAVTEICLSSQTSLTNNSDNNSRPDSQIKIEEFKKTREEIKAEPQPESPALEIATAAACGEIKNFSLEEVRAKWPEFLIKVKNYNHSLSFVLQSCQPKEIKESSICLCFKYKFHENRINEAEIKTVVRSFLTEVYGANINFSTLIDENLQINSANEGTELKTESEKVADTEIKKENLAPAKVEIKEEKKTSADTLGSLLNMFGGEVIN